MSDPAFPAASLSADWQARIRAIPDFPQPGVVFQDIMPLLADGSGFAAAIAALAAPWRAAPPQAVLGIEARGFILGAALAQTLRAGFVPLRKPGKLPGPVLNEAYALEYGHAALEVHADALSPATRVLIVDDVLATGGTLHAALTLARRLRVEVIGAAVLIELPALGGRRQWQAPAPLHAVLQY